MLWVYTMEILNSEEKRKIIFNKLTDEQKEAVGDEIKELNQWYAMSKRNLDEELKREGKWKSLGLDSNQEYLGDIIKEYRARFNEIRKKYGII